MKALALLVLAVAAPFSAFAVNIVIFNTGVDGLGNLLAPGTTDPHYIDLAANPVQAETQHPAWVAAGPTAMYISHSNATQGDGSYTRTYRTTINLAGLDPLSVIIQGKWATDDAGNNILINGNGTGNTSPGFGGFTNFTLLGSSGFFTSGVNNIDFNWTNFSGPGGLVVEYTSATANAIGGVPEPASIALLATGLAGFALLTRRRRSTQR